MASATGSSARPWRAAFPGLIWRAALTAIALFLMAPIVIVVIGSFSDRAYLVFPPTGLSLRWYAAFLSSREFMDSLGVSLRLAAVTTLISTITGAMAALALSALHPRAAEALRGLTAAPLIAPGIVVGIAMLFYFSWLGLSGSFISLLLAHVVLTIPFVVMIVLAGLQTLDRSIEEAAMSLGASKTRAILTITLPLIKGNILAASLFAFIISFDEVIVGLFLASPRLTPLSVRIYHYIEFTSDPSIAAISTCLILVTTVVVFLIDRYVGFARIF